MKNSLLFSLLVAFVVGFVACEDNSMTETITIEGSFYSDEVEIGASTLDVNLPLFSFTDVLEYDSYTMEVYSNTQFLNSWDQSIQEGYRFETTGDVTFKVFYPVDYTMPKATYALKGESYVPYGITTTKVKMTNQEYAAIAIYTQYIVSATINSVDNLPVTNDDNYLYTFVEPSQPYDVEIVDEQGNTHVVNLTSEDIRTNDLTRLYIVKNELTGNFEIVIDWNIIDVPVNPVSLNY